MVPELKDAKTAATETTGSSATSGDGASLLMQSVNLSYQEDARQFIWRAGAKKATLSLSYQQPEVLSDAS